MNKKILIISPYFPPANAADMQRIRTSLPYFKLYGWDAEVVTVDPFYSDMQRDDLLIETVPPDIKIHLVKAFNKNWTSKLGFGNIAYRSYWFYRKKVNILLKEKKYDLIFFSTTQFAICVLGAYWKTRFKIPYVVDMQDPWHSEYYLDKPKHQRPPKYWLSYRVNKYLEPIAIKQADGLISVSENYISDLKNRYPQINYIPAATITFGSFEPDMDIAIKHKKIFTSLLLPGFKNIIYIGRGGLDMHNAITPVFEALKRGIDNEPELYGQLKFYFIGTSYAPAGRGVPTIMPLAKRMGVENNVIEITNRIGYFHTLNILQQADALFVPGSDDPKYTPSKIYPYLLAKKPLLTVFHSHSPVNEILKEYGAKHVYNYDSGNNINKNIDSFLLGVIDGSIKASQYKPEALKKYSAQTLTHKQCELFEKVLSGKI